jgi:hypothetical protein
MNFNTFLQLAATILAIGFTNQESQDNSTQTWTICEGNIIHLECPANQRIQIVGGTYGRSDLFTCLLPRLGCLDCVTTCAINATEKFSQLFNDQRFVLTQLSDSLMGIDPCYGTYKYATISYTCIPDPVSLNETANVNDDGDTLELTIKIE